eukprot:scaffold18303_cov78-Phaeocystis_antarctica.AAC.2
MASGMSNSSASSSNGCNRSAAPPKVLAATRCASIALNVEYSKAIVCGISPAVGYCSLSKVANSIKASDSRPASSNGISAVSGSPVICAAAFTSAMSELESSLSSSSAGSGPEASVGARTRLKVAGPTPKKRRSTAAAALSSSGTTCPPSCHSVVMFSQREGTLHSCAGLRSVSALPSTCNDGVAIDLGTSRPIILGRSSHGRLQKLMKNWRDGERAATAAAMVAPLEMPQMPLIGECCSIQRSTCCTLSLTAAARPASSSAESSRPLNAAVRFGSPFASAATNPHPK